eukprot:scaffold25625_cov42-Phaeocystis_antarctica.AAC.1
MSDSRRCFMSDDVCDGSLKLGPASGVNCYRCCRIVRMWLQSTKTLARGTFRCYRTRVERRTDLEGPSFDARPPFVP